MTSCERHETRHAKQRAPVHGSSAGPGSSPLRRMSGLHQSVVEACGHLAFASRLRDDFQIVGGAESGLPGEPITRAVTLRSGKVVFTVRWSHPPHLGGPRTHASISHVSVRRLPPRPYDRAAIARDPGSHASRGSRVQQPNAPPGTRPSQPRPFAQGLYVPRQDLRDPDRTGESYVEPFPTAK